MFWRNTFSNVSNCSKIQRMRMSSFLLAHLSILHPNTDAIFWAIWETSLKVKCLPKRLARSSLMTLNLDSPKRFILSALLTSSLNCWADLLLLLLLTLINNENFQSFALKILIARNSSVKFFWMILLLLKFYDTFFHSWRMFLG